ncbi:unnamed protein product, partial [Meganyctiphanes norvegica]
MKVQLQLECSALRHAKFITMQLGERKFGSSSLTPLVQLQFDNAGDCLAATLPGNLENAVILKPNREKKLSWKTAARSIICWIEHISQQHVSTLSYSTDLFQDFTIILIVPIEQTAFCEVSEECKEITLSCVETLAKNTTDKVKNDVYGTSFRPQLGHAVFVCLKMAGQEKNRKIKVGAVDALLVLGRSNQLGSLNISSKEQLSTTFAAFLPGIVTGLAKIANADEKQGHKVTVLFLQ